LSFSKGNVDIKREVKINRHDQWSAMWLISPMMFVLMSVAVFPVVYSLWISFFDLKLRRPKSAPFIWFDNYIHVLRDPGFLDSVLRTSSFTLMAVSAIMLLALLVALLLNENFIGKKFLSTILLIPWAVPYVANGLMWKWIYDSGYGALNGALLQLGFISNYLIWLGDTDKTLALIANAFVWKEVPLATILLLVNLKSIPEDLYSAAKVDGANIWQRFWNITLPALKPGFTLVMIYEVMMAVRHFDLFFILTEGGPADASHVLSWEIYVETFRKLSFGLGAALSYLLAVVTFLLAFFIIKTLGKKI
jgi:multiple sugar transport system permease protein